MKKIQSLIQNQIDKIFDSFNLSICSLIVIPCVKDMQIYCFSSYDILNPELYDVNTAFYEGWEYVPCKYSNRYKRADTAIDVKRNDINSSSVFYCPDCNFSIEKATSFLIEVRYIGNISEKQLNNMEKKVNSVLLKKTGKPLYKLKMKEGW